MLANIKSQMDKDFLFYRIYLMNKTKTWRVWSWGEEKEKALSKAGQLDFILTQLPTCNYLRPCRETKWVHLTREQTN